MLPEKIMQSDLLDILFENKNKLYGAYALRKSYNKRLMYSVSVTVFIAAAFAVLQIVYHPHQTMMATEFIIPDGNQLIKIETSKPLPPVAAVKPAPPINQKIYSAPVIVPDDKTVTETPTTDDLTKNTIGDANLVGEGDVNVIQPPSGVEEGKGVAAIQPIEAKVDESPLVRAEVMPQYPGGIEALRKFMLRNLSQPDDLQEGEKIIIMASFIVNKNGQIEKIKINNTGRSDLNKEVGRVINKMPLWKPGMQNGNAVAVYFNLPVTFMSGE